MLLDKIPGLKRAEARAKQKEEEIRRRAFLPCCLQICGINVRALTPRHYILLDEMRSPFFHGGDALPEDVAAFLWVVSTEFLHPANEIPSKELKAARSAFIHRIGPKVKFAKAVKEIRAYVSDALFDAPAAGDDSSPQYASFAAHLVERFHPLPDGQFDSRGQPIPGAGTLDIPFAQIFQRLRVKDAKANPDYTPPNPLSDKVVRECVRKHVAQTAKRKASRHASMTKE